MGPGDLLDAVGRLLWPLADDAARRLADPMGLAGLPPDPGAAGTPLADRLLAAVPELPAGGGGLAELVRDVLGDLRDGPVRLHGWLRAPGGPRGVALVARDAAGAPAVVLAVTPGGPVLDVVVLGAVRVDHAEDAWRLEITADLTEPWDLSVTPGAAAQVRLSPLGGTVGAQLTRGGRLAVGPPSGPGVAVAGLSAQLTVAVAERRPALRLTLVDFTAQAVPPELAGLLGSAATTPTTVLLDADPVGGLRFAGTGTTRVDLPARLPLPGLGTRGFGLELSTAGTDLRLGAYLSLAADLPGLPLHLRIDRVGLDVPLALAGDRLGAAVERLAPVLPAGMGVQLTLPPVSGGGLVTTTGPGAFAGLLDLDLAAFRVQAIGLVQLPVGGAPLSLLVLMSARFPGAGIQLGFGFAIDAVGGLIGVNRRADADQLRELVSGGHADRVLFPDDARGEAPAIIAALGAGFPVARGRTVVGPMVRISWGGRIVSLSAAVVLDLPNPVQIVLLGRLLIALPDPEVPLIRLQASVFGRIDPAVPLVELLVSLAGSWIVGIPVSGEIYLLFRGGRQPAFVLSAGGFHPRYVRPAGVPALRRLAVDLGFGSGWGLRAEAYFALTSNAVQFGGQVQLDASIAGCGVEGWLGLDALFVWEPTFAFSVHVYAGVAVKAFGRRLASVGLDFTLEGPAPWHAFGTGSISVLFWDVSLDFDVSWGESRTAVPPAQDPVPPLTAAFARREAWAVQRPVGDQTGLVYTADAAAELAAGTLTHPDARLRASQSVLPLGVPITRFERAPLAAQTWTVAGADLGGGALPVGALGPVTDDFVPGEFFTMTEDEQLSRPAFQEYASGLSLVGEDVVLGAAHRADDSYETAYEPPLGGGRRFGVGIGRYDLEVWARELGSAERTERWRAAAPAAVVVRPPVLAAVDAGTLRMIDADMPVVSAVASVAQLRLDRLGVSTLDGVRLVDRWEAAG